MIKLRNFGLFNSTSCMTSSLIKLSWYSQRLLFKQIEGFSVSSLCTLDAGVQHFRMPLISNQPFLLWCPLYKLFLVSAVFVRCWHNAVIRNLSKSWWIGLYMTGAGSPDYGMLWVRVYR